MDTVPVDFRFGVSVGRTGILFGPVLFPNEAEDGALLRADELGSELSVALR